MAISLEDLNRGDLSPNAPLDSALKLPVPAQEAYPLLLNGQTPQELEARLHAQYPDVTVVGADQDSVGYFFTSHYYAPGLETDLSSGMPPVYTRNCEINVVITESGVAYVGNADEETSEMGLPMPLVGATFESWSDPTGATDRSDSRGFSRQVLGAAEYQIASATQIVKPVVSYHGSYDYTQNGEAVTLDEKDEGPGAESLEAIGIINRLFPGSSTSEDVTAAFLQARNLHESGRPDVVVGDIDGEGRAAVVMYVIGGDGVLYTYKYILDTINGRALYYHHNSNSLNPNPRGKAHDTEETQTGGTLFEYDTDGRTSRRMTRVSELSPTTGQYTMVDDDVQYMYTGVPLVDDTGSPRTDRPFYFGPSSHREIRYDANVITVDFDFAASVMSPLDVNPREMYDVQGQRAVDIRTDDAVAVSPAQKTVGEVFTREYVPSVSAQEKLVMQMRVVANASGQLEPELIQASLAPVKHA